MKKAIDAILWHCANFTDSEIWHRFCPSGEESWCKYKRGKMTGKSNYKETINLPKSIHDIIFPILIHYQTTNY